jgi:hypothetical protein
MKHAIPQPTDDPQVFTLPSSPAPPESLMLFLNGILADPAREFELRGSEIHYTEPVDECDRQRAWYEEAA